MKLYLVVHHKQDADQPWANSWSDDQRLDAIQTTTQIGNLCKQAQRVGDPIFVHRCAWGNFSPVVCCSVRISRVEWIDRSTALVKFTDVRDLNLKPPFSPAPGQNFYVAG